MDDYYPINDNIPRDPDREPEIQLKPVPDPTPRIDATNPYPFCSRCGKSRAGLAADERCTYCSTRPEDPTCSFCGYILTGLSVNDKCPECGKPIWDSNILLPTSGYSTASMVLGILSIISCMFYGFPSLVLGGLALVFAHMGRNQLRNGMRAGATKGFCAAGTSCGIVGLSLGMIYLVIILIVIFNM